MHDPLPPADCTRPSASGYGRCAAGASAQGAQGARRPAEASGGSPWAEAGGWALMPSRSRSRSSGDATAALVSPKGHGKAAITYSTALPLRVRCCSGFHTAAAELQGLHTAAAELQGHWAVHLRLPCYTGDHIPLDVAKTHWTSYIDTHLRRGSCALRFKIGITHKPVYRFEEGNGAYQPLGYHRMDVLFAADNTMETADLERFLIARYRGHRQCLNQASGGEAAGVLVPHFTYVAWLSGCNPQGLIRYNGANDARKRPRSSRQFDFDYY